MFRRRWTGLPADPTFPSNLHDLGYLVNDEDEVRSMTSPDEYYQFFMTKNERFNERKRFGMNAATRAVIHDRLQALGLEKVLLPLGTTDPSQPHVPIFVSKSLLAARAPPDAGARGGTTDVSDDSPPPTAPRRVVVIFGETVQDLGVLAQRVVGGRGGINAGSMVSVVHALQSYHQHHDAQGDDNDDGHVDGGGGGSPLPDAGSASLPPPGIILANTGELWWWPEGCRGLSPPGRHMAPMASAAHTGRYYDPDRNAVPANEGPAQHVRYVFEKAIPELLLRPGGGGSGGGGDGHKDTNNEDSSQAGGDDVKLDVIAVGDAADLVEAYLDNDRVWAHLGRHMGSLAVLRGFIQPLEPVCAGFREFIWNRSRSWVINTEDPLNTPMRPRRPGFCVPAYGAGPDACLVETLLVEAYPAVVAWICGEVGCGGDDYANALHLLYEPRMSAEGDIGDAECVQYWGGAPGEGESGLPEGEGSK